MLINVIYASTSGNVEATVEFIAKILKSSGHDIVLNRAEKTSADIFKKNKLFIFATSTWEHGKLNPFFEKLLQEMKSMDFNGKQAAFVGLGDTRYEPVLFCEGAQIIRDVWFKNRGEEIGNMLKINGEPYANMNMLVEPWAQMLTKTLKFHDA